MYDIKKTEHTNIVRNITVESRLIYAPKKGCMQAGQRRYMGQILGSYIIRGKILQGEEKLYCSRYYIDYNKVPTDSIRSNEDYIKY